MIMSNSFEAFTYVREAAPFFTIAAIFQKDPQVMIAHPGSGFDSFEKMKGRPLLISNGSRSTFWPYLRKKYGLSDAQLRPYNFNMAPFLADPQAIQQGFVTSEVYSIARRWASSPRRC
jgi:NitT/TauT family transport system substrate-binding protein